MKHYNLMVLRSYLDQPDKYVQPTLRHEHREMDMLKPHINRLELHEYPKEHVLVLEGENLWFSLKITLGKHEHPISNLHNATKYSVQFNFTPSSKISSAILDGEKVQVTLYTHFGDREIESVECKKVKLTNYCF